MFVAGVDFGYAIDRDRVSPLDGKRVIGRLEFDERANPAVAEMHARPHAPARALQAVYHNALNDP